MSNASATAGFRASAVNPGRMSPAG